MLDKIIAVKKRELRIQKEFVPLEKLKKQVYSGDSEKRDFRGSLSGNEVALIAEIKRASPSKGLLNSSFNACSLAKCYEKNGAKAISVITEKEHFLGDPDSLSEVRKCSSLPLLRKDFIIEPYQIFESRALGADALLLITRLLNKNSLKTLLTLTEDLEMEALVEVHNREEIETALECGASVIGINNRDLKTFDSDLENTFKLIGSIPEKCFTVSESGIYSYEQIGKLKRAGVDAVLVGEALVTAFDIASKVRELSGR